MAHRKDNSNLQGSAKGIGGKPEPGPLPVPKMEPKAGKELHIIDLEDKTDWMIRDETVVELLKKHHAAPDQKTKDEILKLLKSRIASTSNAVEASQPNKQFQESKSALGLDSKLVAELQTLKLSSDSKASVEKKGLLEASQPNKQFQESKSVSGLDSKISEDLQKLILSSDSKSSVEKKGSSDRKSSVEKKGSGDSKSSVEKKGSSDSKSSVEKKGSGDSKSSVEKKGSSDSKSSVEKKGSDSKANKANKKDRII